LNTESILPILHISEASTDLENAQVWIQGEKVSGKWFFHDGTAMDPHFCPLSDSTKAAENRMRFRPSKGSSCFDQEGLKQYHFVCEITFRIRA
jgi:hypothetical protein